MHSPSFWVNGLLEALLQKWLHTCGSYLLRLLGGRLVALALKHAQTCRRAFMRLCMNSSMYGCMHLCLRVVYHERMVKLSSSGDIGIYDWQIAMKAIHSLRPVVIIDVIKNSQCIIVTLLATHCALRHRALKFAFLLSPLVSRHFVGV